MRGWLVIGLLLAAAPLAAQDDWEDDWEDPWQGETGTGLAWTGFAEAAGGTRFDEDALVGRRGTLLDARLRLETEWTPERFTIAFKADGLYDGIDQDFDFDLRELTIAGTPIDKLDAKAGRQVLTWGTGDLLFLNDLFPKDWVSFFAGRDDEYLKAPSNSLRLTRYGDLVNVDLAWTLFFTPDDYITGERFSFFSPLAGGPVAPDPPFGAERPDKNLDNGELALRLFRNVRGVEYALYGYRGFFKQPSDFTNPANPGFAPLTAAGASVRRALWSGLWNAEFSYYFSRDDSSGTNPGIPNDQLRFLTGFEREWFTNFTIGLQYYLEWTQDHDELLTNSPTPQFEPDERRHLLTTRVTYRALQDKLTWSLFAFVSPSDEDFYLRPVVSFRYSDEWIFTAGANLFGGDEIYTFFSQFEDANNVYVRVRYNY